MRAREFIIKEDGPIVNPNDSTGAPGTDDENVAPGGNSQIQQLTAATAALKKQVLDLQKAALASGAGAQPAPTQAAPAPGEASQQQVPKGTVGTGTGNGTLDQQQQPPVKPGQPMGQPGQPGQAGVATATNQAAQPATPPAPPVQKPMPPGVTNLAKTQQDIKNKLIQNVASGK